MMTDRLYYTDAYAREFDARIVERAGDGRTVYLDRTAFYATSGGQPHDRGTLNGVAVLSVEEEDDGRLAHQLAAPVAGDSVRGVIDWARRWDHMQQHTGQHLLSAVLAERFGMPTVSFHLGDAVSTIDVQPKGLTPEKLRDVEWAANAEIAAGRAVSVTFEDAATAVGLRKESGREGVLRIVTIDGLDRSACGGTHVRTSAEIGALLLRKVEKVRDTMRIEFVCGGRAIRRARADFDAIARVARVYSCAVDEAAEAVEAAQARLAEAEKANRRMAGELATQRGRELYAATAETGGVRVAVRMLPALTEDLRAEAAGFTAAGAGVFIAGGREPASVMVACSAAGGHHAGNLLKDVLAARGGRGGGSAALAQGSVADAGAVTAIVEELAARVRR